MSTVLVTGGSGFLAGHCILKLLEAGYRVRTTVRSLEREPEVRAMVNEAGSRLSLLAADLRSDAGWHGAAEGCEFVMHVASPLPRGATRHEDELIVPAREGTLRVLRAARQAGVRRVVITSSFGAVAYGHPPRAEPFDETHWTDPDGPGVSSYAKSKTLAERAAWEFAADGGTPELAVINPVAVLGPVLGSGEPSTSIQLVKRLLDGLWGVPRIGFGLVDVRDVADLHLRAMLDPAAKGERFIATTGNAVPMTEIARVLGLSTPQVPDWLVRAAALGHRGLRELLPQLGTVRNGTSAKARRILGWEPRSYEEAILATARSLRGR